MSCKVTTEDFILRAKSIHGYKYDYSRVVYVNAKSHVLLRCNICGTEFWQTPSNHLHGYGCEVCARRIRQQKLAKTTSQFIEESIRLWGTQFDYSECVYVNAFTPVKLKCNICGNYVSIIPANHLTGSGCLYCGIQRRSDIRRKSVAQFVDDAIAVHGDIYDYSHVNYVNSRTPIEIICEKHGSFMQAPESHLSGSGCPVCRCSSLERHVRLLLERHDISYEPEHSFNWLVNPKTGYSLFVDFYLPDYDVVIECQGEQHFDANHSFCGNETLFPAVVYRDNVKHDLCVGHGLKVLYYANRKPYVLGYRYPLIFDDFELLGQIECG